MQRIGLGLVVAMIAMHSRMAFAAEVRAQLLIQATVVAGCAGIGAQMSGAAQAIVAMTCDFETPYTARVVTPYPPGAAMPALAAPQRGAAAVAMLRTGTGAAPGGAAQAILSIDF